MWSGAPYPCPQYQPAGLHHPQQFYQQQQQLFVPAPQQSLSTIENYRRLLLEKETSICLLQKLVLEKDAVIARLQKKLEEALQGGKETATATTTGGATTTVSPAAAATNAEASGNDNGNNEEKEEEPVATAATTGAAALTTSFPNQNRNKRKRDATYEAKWNTRYRELVEYKKKHGDCLVPLVYPANPKLGNWVHTQRQHYRRTMKKKQQSGDAAPTAPNNNDNDKEEEEEASKNETPYRMTPDRLFKLHEVGFRFDEVGQQAREEAWETRFRELVFFKTKHGHCLVPSRFPANPRLAAWVKVQRRRHAIAKGAQNNEGKTRLPEERIHRLEQLGFTWWVGRNGLTAALQEQQQQQPEARLVGGKQIAAMAAQANNNSDEQDDEEEEEEEKEEKDTSFDDFLAL